MAGTRITQLTLTATPGRRYGSFAGKPLATATRQGIIGGRVGTYVG